MKRTTYTKSQMLSHDIYIAMRRARMMIVCAFISGSACMLALALAVQ